MDSRFDGSEASFSSMAARNTEFDPTTGSLAPATSQWSPGAGTTKDRGPGTAPRREGFRRTRASFQVGGCTQSSWGRRRDRSKPSQGIEESSPASSASFNTRQGDAKVSRNGPGRRPGPKSWFCKPRELARLSAEVVEGEQRLATLRAELERPQPPVVPVDMSAEVERLRALVEQLLKEKEDGRPEVDPSSFRPQFRSSSGGAYARS